MSKFNGPLGILEFLFLSMNTGLLPGPPLSFLRHSSRRRAEGVVVEKAKQLT